MPYYDPMTFFIIIIMYLFIIIPYFCHGIRITSAVPYSGECNTKLMRKMNLKRKGNSEEGRWMNKLERRTNTRWHRFLPIWDSINVDLLGFVGFVVRYGPIRRFFLSTKVCVLWKIFVFVYIYVCVYLFIIKSVARKSGTERSRC